MSIELQIIETEIGYITRGLFTLQCKIIDAKKWKTGKRLVVATIAGLCGEVSRSCFVAKDATGIKIVDAITGTVYDVKSKKCLTSKQIYLKKISVNAKRSFEILLSTKQAV